tara:strand:- start:55 stop:228 length:174 start_codon:yes stop_codon:yes gene_type:complete
MRVSPGIHYRFASHGVETIVEDNIDFWYDSINDCYENNMPIDLICVYVEAIGNEDME